MKKQITYPSVDLTFFRWFTPFGGFEWTRSSSHFSYHDEDTVGQKAAEGSEAGWFLHGVTSDPWSQRDCYPLQESGLFRTFSELPATREEVAAFATRFGSLWGSFQQGETLQQWQTERDALKEAIDLWDAIRASKGAAKGTDEGATAREYLARMIQWRSGNAVVYNPTSSLAFRILPQARAGMQPLPQHQAELFNRFTPRELILPAWEALRTLLNKKLAEHASKVEILWDNPNKRDPGLILQLVPDSLIAALWLQFATAIDGDKNYRRCDACRKWFALGSRGRDDAKYCSTACRFRAYRNRIERAGDRAAAGVPVSQIAEELETDVRTAKGWIRKTKRKQPKKRKGPQHA